MFITYFNSVQWKIVELNRPCNFYYDTIYCFFFFFQNVVTCLSYNVDKYLFKVKSRNTTLIYWLLSKSTIRTPEWCHAVFTFTLKHIQQINLIFSLLTLNMYLPVGHRIKSTKQLKCTLMLISKSPYMLVLI